MKKIPKQEYTAEFKEQAVKHAHVLTVSISGYRAWRRGGTPDRTRLTDLLDVALIKSIHAEVKASCGSRRMHQELQGRGSASSTSCWTRCRATSRRAA